MKKNWPERPSPALYQLEREERNWIGSNYEVCNREAGREKTYQSWLRLCLKGVAPEEKVVGDCLELLVHLEGDHDHDVADHGDESNDAKDDG